YHHLNSQCFLSHNYSQSLQFKKHPKCHHSNSETPMIFKLCLTVHQDLHQDLDFHHQCQLLHHLIKLSLHLNQQYHLHLLILVNLILVKMSPNQWYGQFQDKENKMMMMKMKKKKKKNKKEIKKKVRMKKLVQMKKITMITVKTKNMIAKLI